MNDQQSNLQKAADVLKETKNMVLKELSKEPALNLLKIEVKSKLETMINRLEFMAGHGRPAY